MNLGRNWNERVSVTKHNMEVMYPGSLLYEARSEVSNLDEIDLIFYYLNPSSNIPHHIIVHVDKDGKESIVSENDYPWIGCLSYDPEKVNMTIEESLGIIKNSEWRYVSMKSPIKFLEGNVKYVYGNDYNKPFLSVDTVTREVSILE